MTAATLQNAGEPAAFQHKHGPKQLANVAMHRLHRCLMFMHTLSIGADLCRGVDRGFAPQTAPRWTKASHDTHVTKGHNWGRSACQSVTLVRRYYGTSLTPFGLKRITKNTYEALCIFDLHPQALFYRWRRSPIRNTPSAERVIHFKNSPQGYTSYQLHTRWKPTHTDSKP